MGAMQSQPEQSSLRAELYFMNDMDKRLKIAFVTTLDPQNRRTWSGTIYYIAKALQKHCGEVTFIGPIRSWERTLGKILHKVSRLLLKKNFAYNASFLVAKKHARLAAQKLAGQEFDLIVAPTGAADIAFLQTNTPIVLIEDATFAILQNYYPQYSNLLGLSARQADAISQLAINNASLAIYSSEWAAQSAREIYHADAGKVHVVPFGANFDEPPSKKAALARKRSDRCTLLFLGVDWQRKGGEIAFETLLKLEDLGIQAELIVCGCVPPTSFSHERMKVIPFLDKNDETQRKELENLFMTSDFLLLPTRSECYGVVFCEASSYGLPSITTNTGGVSGVIKDGENGFMLPHDARGSAYAEVIAQLYRDEQRYYELVKSSRAAYDERLNWDAWGIAVKRIISDIPVRHRGIERDMVKMRL
jgi:glycosyltransferase involved in cell wall biosynthesis